MLGQVRGTRLASFGARDEDCAELAQSGIQHRIRIRLLTGAEPRVEVATLANRDPLFDDYGHHLWLFTSLADQSRESDLQYLEETVTAVARQTRAPLLMADGLLRGAKNLLREPEQMQDCASLLDQAANHLLKADLTFERLSERLTVQQTPRDAPIEFDVLQGLEREIDNLPQEDREAVAIIDKIDPTARALVKGWPERLSFAFRSALGSLLMLRVTPTDKLTVEIAESPPRYLLIRMHLPELAIQVLETQVVDPIERSQIRAREMASVAVEAIEMSIAQHGGTLTEQHGTGFEIRLPLCAEETAP
jgi:hypothetical protein